MAEPKQKSLSPFIVKAVPQYYTPNLDGSAWRRVVRNVPIAGLCRQRLISYIRSMEWSISARDIKSGDFETDIDYYTSVILADFDNWIDKTLQDALDMPVGGTIEVVRYDKKAKIKHNGKALTPSEKGHVAKVVHVDGATLYPTGDERYPLVQRYGTERVTFPSESIGRIIMSPRPEIDMLGYGMAPPELIYLALRMVYAGDVYFGGLIEDAPESGILYLGNITEEDAANWLEGFRTLFTGGSQFKVPVTYGEQPPAMIPFSRSPVDITFTEQQMKYAKLITAAYGLKLSDLGIDGGEQTLAGKIRDQVAARLTGFGTIQNFVENLINNSVLPSYLKFRFRIKDPEQLIQTNRARVLALQWAKTAIDAGVLSAETIRKQLSSDGLFTIDIEEDEAGGGKELPPSNGKGLPGGSDNGNNSQDTVGKELKLKSPENGGRGDIKQEKSFAVNEVKAARSSAALISDATGMDMSSAFTLLSMFHNRESRKQVSAAIKKKDKSGDALAFILNAMHERTISTIGESEGVKLYRKLHKKLGVGDTVPVRVPVGDVWTEQRSAVPGRAIAATFEPSEIISMSRRGTGFGDPYTWEVLVYGGVEKIAEVV